MPTSNQTPSLAKLAQSFTYVAERINAEQARLSACASNIDANHEYLGEAASYMDTLRQILYDVVDALSTLAALDENTRAAMTSYKTDLTSDVPAPTDQIPIPPSRLTI